MLEVVKDTEPLLRHGIVKHEVLHQVELRENRLPVLEYLLLGTA